MNQKANNEMMIMYREEEIMVLLFIIIIALLLCTGFQKALGCGLFGCLFELMQVLVGICTLKNSHIIISGKEQ